jgi:hypothetical protein
MLLTDQVHRGLVGSMVDALDHHPLLERPFIRNGLLRQSILEGSEMAALALVDHLSEEELEATGVMILRDAVSVGYKEVVERVLYSQGVLADERVLVRVVYGENVEMAELFMTYVSDVDKELANLYGNNFSPLFYARLAEMARMLVDRGADLGWKGDFNITPLLNAIVRRFPSTHFFVEVYSPEQLLAQDTMGHHALLYALSYRQLDIAELILDRVPQALQLKTFVGWSALKQSCNENRIPACKLLLRYCSPDDITKEIMQVTVGKGHLDVLLLLIKAGGPLVYEWEATPGSCPGGHELVRIDWGDQDNRVCDLCRSSCQFRVMVCKTCDVDICQPCSDRLPSICLTESPPLDMARFNSHQHIVNLLEFLVENPLGRALLDANERDLAITCFDKGIRMKKDLDDHADCLEVLDILDLKKMM